MRTSSLLHCLCTLLLLALSAQAQLLPEPRLASKFQLPNLTFQRGNALIDYLGSVVATTAEGSLVRFDPSDNTITYTFTPEITAGQEISSSSGISLLRGDLAIYSVIDAARDDAETTSRVLCVNLEDGTLVWSVSVNGRAIGTPQVSEEYVYVVHNTIVGGITIFRLDGEGEPVAVGSFITDDTTLGPPSLVTVDNQDALAVASNRDNGLSEEGGLYVLIEQVQEGGGGREEGGGGPEREEGNTEDQSAPFRFINISTFLRSSVTAPLLSENMALIVTEQGASLTGFVGENDLSDVLSADFQVENKAPRWQRFVDENPDNADAPILSTPIFSSTGEMAFAASAGPQFTAVMLQDGVSAWTVNTESLIEASPVLSGDVVYTIESNGRVSQYDAIAGEVNWVMDCDIAGTCDTSIEADFALSESGNELYFGDINGNIVSVIVGGASTTAPTRSPIARPSEGLAPTRSPTEQTQNTEIPIVPTIEATDTPTTALPTAGTMVPGEVDQQSPNNDQKKSSGYIAAAVVSVAALIVAFAVCIVCRRNATSKKDLSSELKAQQLAYERACRNAEKEALEEIMKERHNEEMMEQSATESFFYADQTLTTPMSMSMPGMSLADTYYQKYGQDKGDSDSEEQIGFEVAAGGKQQISPVFGRTVDSSKESTLKSSRTQQSSEKQISPAMTRAVDSSNVSTVKNVNRQQHNATPAQPVPVTPSVSVDNVHGDDEEPGRIVFREKDDDAEDNESQRPPSPAYSDVMSDDDSLYTTEEPRPLASRYMSDDPKQMIGRSFSRDSSYPDDESSKASAFPGMSSYFRSPAKPTSPQAVTDATETKVNAARILAHAGVSVRQAPSKSRAGLFSRRSPAVLNKASPTNTTLAPNNDSMTAGRIAKSPSESKHSYEEFKPQHVPVSSPPPQVPVSVPPPEKDEETTPSASSDVWNSFLSELAKAEKSFFGSSDDKAARPPSPPPPPPPRDGIDSPPQPSSTSSAVASKNRTKPVNGGNKGYFWV